MTTDEHIPLASFYLLERTEPSLPKLHDLGSSILETLGGLGIAAEELRGKRIAVAVGSRGIASLKEIVQAVCGWLKAQGAQPFIFPAMGSHGGGTPGAAPDPRGIRGHGSRGGGGGSLFHGNCPYRNDP